MAPNIEGLTDQFRPQSIGNIMHSGFVHNQTDAKLIGINQANISTLRQFSQQSTLADMEEKPRPYLDIAERLKWHRSLTGLNQAEYAETIKAKRAALSLCEAGTHRLSLDNARAIRSKYGLSLDFIYEGEKEALPMTLRMEWEKYVSQNDDEQAN